MKVKMNANEIEQVNGGNFIDTMKDILNKIFPDPKEPKKPIIPDFPQPVMARGKC